MLGVAPLRFTATTSKRATEPSEVLAVPPVLAAKITRSWPTSKLDISPAFLMKTTKVVAVEAGTAATWPY